MKSIKLTQIRKCRCYSSHGSINLGSLWRRASFTKT